MQRSLATADANGHARGDDTRAVLEALARIEARLDRVEALAADAVREGRGAVAMATDAFDRAIASAQARGIDVDARAKRVLGLLERASEPAVLDSLETLIGLAEQTPGAIAALTDTVDRTIARAREDGIDLDARLANLVRAADMLSSDPAIAMLDATFGRVEQIRAVVESGILEPASVAIVEKAGRALAGAAGEHGAGVGALGLMRALGDGDVRAATGFLVRFARRLGRDLQPAAAPELAADNPSRSARA